MGKVYDALRKAEEQRARRLQEATEAGAASPIDFVAPPRRDDDAPRATPGATVFERARETAAPASLEGGDVHNKRRIVILQPESAIAEQFRSLRARLDALDATRPLRTIAVTSAVSGEGKTMAAISLAAVSAMQLGSKVVLVECDLREPTIAAALGLRVDAGLTEVLVDGASLDDAIQRAPGTQLDVLAVRGLPQNPSELLSSERMRALLETLARRYERVILDLPPTLGLPDAKTVSGMCDGTVFVVRADSTQQAEIEGALEVLGRDRLLGIVMNATDTTPPAYGKYAQRG
jgi:capsular exopolysaccharide synthesis family protein